jgi:hypothetical protein
MPVYTCQTVASMIMACYSHQMLGSCANIFIYIDEVKLEILVAYATLMLFLCLGHAAMNQGGNLN